MNKIDAKELETRLEDLWSKAQKELKPREINSSIISAYQSKGIADGQTAWILYNLGVNAIQLDNNPNHPGTGVQSFTYDGNSYNLLNASSLRDFVQVKSQKINPLFDKEVTWVNTGGTGKGQDLTIEEKNFITDLSLDTAQAVHAGTVLLAYLRAIKKSVHPDNNYELNQDAGNPDRDWTIETTNQKAINTQIKTPIFDERYQILEDYANANQGTVKGLVWININAAFGKIASKILNKLQTLNGQIFVNQFKTIQITGNRADRNWTQLTLGKIKEIFGPENFDEIGKYIGGGPTKPLEHLLLEKINQEKINQALEKLKDKWTKPSYKNLTSKILNDLLGDWKDLRAKKDWTSLKVGRDDNLYRFLTTEGGYEIDKNRDGSTNLEGKEILEKEEKFEIEEKGTLLLDYFYKKVNFDIDKPIDNQICQLTEKELESGKKIKLLDTSGLGILPIGTGVGKTTKFINCLVRGGEQNVILVCPTPALVHSAYGHHKNWLQDWECVYHKELDENNQQKWVDVVDKKTNKPIYDESGNIRQRRKYIHHGKYKVVKNDLVYNEEAGEMENGLSILEPGYLFGYLTRNLFLEAINKKSGREKRKFLEWYKDEIDEMEKKLIPKDKTIIVFDEAHFGAAMYQELIRQTIQLGYKVICMSATFKGKDFSITSSYKIDSRLVSGFKPDLDKNLKNEKTFLFLKNMNLNEKQKEILEKSKISYIIFDKSYEAAAEGISEGMPPGSLMIGDNTYEMGFTFDIDNAITTGWMEMAKLEPGWVYSRPPHTQELPIASLIQQRGRVGRKKDGKWYSLSDQTKEITVTKDYAASLVRATLTKDASEVGTKNKELNDWDYLAGGISLPEKFGLPPEAIIVGITGSPNKPKFNRKDGPPGCDANLWYKHVNKTDKPIEMSRAELAQAKEILKLMVDTLLSQQKNFPYRIKIEIENPLIEKTGLKVEEIKPILNSFIENKLTELSNNEEYNKEKKSSQNEKLIQDIIELYKLALAENVIEIVKEDKDLDNPEKGKKENKTLWILYKAQKREVEI